MWRDKPTIKSIRKEIVGDSIKLEKLMKKLLQLVREDERTKVLSITDRARERAADRG
jgi:hypothetical protein